MYDVVRTEVVHSELKSLGFAQDNTALLVLLVLEDSDVSLATLLPCRNIGVETVQGRAPGDYTLIDIVLYGYVEGYNDD